MILRPTILKYTKLSQVLQSGQYATACSFCLVQHEAQENPPQCGLQFNALRHQSESYTSRGKSQGDRPCLHKHVGDRRTTFDLPRLCERISIVEYVKSERSSRRDDFWVPASYLSEASFFVTANCSACPEKVLTASIGTLLCLATTEDFATVESGGDFC